MCKRLERPLIVLLGGALLLLAACGSNLMPIITQGAPTQPAPTQPGAPTAPPTVTPAGVAPPTPTTGGGLTPMVPVQVVTTTPLAPATASPAEAAQAEFDRLSRGRILYNPPAEMQVDETERVEVRISMDPEATLEVELKGSGAPQVESIPVSAFMKVRLMGDAFRITSFSSEEQVVPAQGYTEWDFDVTPNKSGEQSLSLVVTARVKLPGYGDEQKDLKIIERQIRVRVTAGQSMGAWLRTNKTWLYPAVVVPSVTAVGGWLWKRYRKSKKPGSPPSGGEAAKPPASGGPVGPAGTPGEPSQ